MAICARVCAVDDRCYYCCYYMKCYWYVTTVIGASQHAWLACPFVILAVKCPWAVFLCYGLTCLPIPLFRDIADTHLTIVAARVQSYLHHSTTPRAPPQRFCSTTLVHLPFAVYRHRHPCPCSSRRCSSHRLPCRACSLPTDTKRAIHPGRRLEVTHVAQSQVSGAHGTTREIAI